MYKAYFLDNRTMVLHEHVGDGNITVARYDIPTQERTAIVENMPWRSGTPRYATIARRDGSGAHHGLVYEEDGSVWLVDLWTGEHKSLAGLDMTGVYEYESPDGKMVLFAYAKQAKDEKTCVYYPKIGLLNTETGEMLMLNRDVSGNWEYCYCFLNSNTVVIGSQRDENGGYYYYIYEFVY